MKPQIIDMGPWDTTPLAQLERNDEAHALSRRFGDAGEAFDASVERNKDLLWQAACAATTAAEALFEACGAPEVSAR